MTERENLKLMYEQKQPEWVPVWQDAVDTAGISFLTDWWKGQGELKKGDILTDYFGTEFVISDPHMSPLPNEKKVHIPDITEWKKYLTLPDLDQLDWETMAKKATSKLNRENKMVETWIGGSGVIFVRMVNMLGHENAMASMLLEPEAWHEIVSEITDWWCGVIRYAIQYINPDIIFFSDDIAHNPAPFMSPATYREMIKPYMARMIRVAKEAGCYVNYHCCGNVESLIDDWVEMGIQLWQAQPVNDLKAIKARLGNRLIISQAWDCYCDGAKPGADEEVVRATVRGILDELAPGGGYIFDIEGRVFEWEIGKEQYGWIMDEARRYGREFYKKQ